MKIAFNLSDDLGWKHHRQGIVEAQSPIDCIRSLLADPEIQARFEGRPYASLLIHAMPAASELGYEQKLYLQQQPKEEAAA